MTTNIGSLHVYSNYVGYVLTLWTWYAARNSVLQTDGFETKSWKGNRLCYQV